LYRLSKMLDISDSVTYIVADYQSGKKQIPSRTDFYEKHPELEETCVLACGHIIGYTCVFKWHLENGTCLPRKQHDPSSMMVKCFICGTQKFEECGHALRIFKVSPLRGLLPDADPLKASNERLLRTKPWTFDPVEAIRQQVPLTKAEGAKPPALCFDCDFIMLEYIKEVDHDTKCGICYRGMRPDRNGRYLFDYSRHREEYLDFCYKVHVRQLANMTWPRCYSRNSVRSDEVDILHRYLRNQFESDMLNKGGRFYFLRELAWIDCEQRTAVNARLGVMSKVDAKRYADMRAELCEYLDKERYDGVLHRSQPGWSKPQLLPTSCRHCNQNVDMPVGYIINPECAGSLEQQREDDLLHGQDPLTREP
jgi:hypothetical protein